jgi:hypothetical protein
MSSGGTSYDLFCYPARIGVLEGGDNETCRDHPQAKDIGE